MTNLANTVSSLPDPNSVQSIGWIILCLFAVIAGMNQAARFVDRFKEKPVPADTYVTKEVFQAVVGGLRDNVAQLQKDIAAMREEIHNGFYKINEANERRAKEIHDRVNPLLEAAGAIKAKK